VTPRHLQVLRPQHWPEALAMRARYPAALPIAGGTGVMSALQRTTERPPQLLDLSRVRTFRDWWVTPDWVRLAPGLSYTELAERLAGPLPGLASAAAQVGSRQVRNLGTIGGALGLAAPAGDLHPVLLAAGAEIELSSARASRWVSAGRFYRGPGRTELAPDELITAVRLPRPAGRQKFLRIGRRRGMVKTICSVAVVLDVGRKTAGVGVGGFGPVPYRARSAADFLTAELRRDLQWRCAHPLPGEFVDRFGQLVAVGVEPETDPQATAQYRRHAVAVLAGRCLRAAWDTAEGQGACDD
jgi:CO/xanthine dehydrogenase FAD-binding subunit